MSNRNPQRQPNTGRSQNQGRRKNTQVPVNKKPQNNKKPPPKKKPPQKKKITKQQAEINRRKAEQRKKLLKKKRKEARKIFFNRLVMFFVVFIVFLLLSVGIFFINLIWNIKFTSNSYVYQIGEDKTAGTITRNVTYDTLYTQNRIYINFSELAEMYECIITGDKDSIRYIIPDAAGNVVDDVKFMLNTTLAYVNGVPARMESPVFFKGEVLYVPMKFFNDYVSGLKVQYTDYDKKLLITKATPETTEIWFNIELHSATENIPETSLDYELLYLTDPVRLANEKRLREEAEAKAREEMLAGENTQ
jgi:hypothetical protein